MIQLNINYDPDYPFSCQQEEQMPTKHSLFPLDGGAVSVLGLKFRHARANTRGFDPYAGDRWTCSLGHERGRLGKLELDVTDLVCATVEVEWIKYGDDFRKLRMPSGYWKGWQWCEYEWRQMPWVWRKLWDFLEYRLAWWQENTDFGGNASTFTHDGDDYGYYE